METLAQLLPFVLIAVVFWLLLIRPQRRRQMEMMATQRAVTVGDEVLLGAGIVGRVATESDDFLELEISPGVLMKVARGAVVRVIQPDDLTEDVLAEPAAQDPVDPTDVSKGTDPVDPSRDH